jgi:3-hydroxyacyl-CoA dehydrogenase / enoyl-CoA hydratase / 3-hydroxybutyryl-CoA epimerase
MLLETPRLSLESADGVATLWLDAPADFGLLDDLGRAARRLRRVPGPDVLMVRFDRPLGPPPPFAAPDAARTFAELGQRRLRHLAALARSMATVALIDGPCFGPALELALACDFRLALDRPETQIGFPGVLDGATPCWGGTVRLPRLVGLGPALEMLLTGRLLPARAARALGLVDHAFGPRPAKVELLAFVAELQDRPGRRRARPPWWRRLRDVALGRRLLGRFRARHPGAAQGELLRLVAAGWLHGPADGLAAERAAFARLAPSAAAG